MGEDGNRFSLLLVDDEPQILNLLQIAFAEDNYQIYTSSNGREAIKTLKRTKIDAALIDLMLPEMDGLTLLQEIRKRAPAIMVIMLTGHGGIRDAVKATQLGAIDFLEKPFEVNALRVRIGQLHRIWQLNEENRKLRAGIRFKFGYHDLVGNSTSILKLKEMIASVGHVKGAFTGAHTATLGLIRAAHKGTLFLYEVGDLSPAIQVKLLRTIQEKEVRPVGSSRSHPVNVRILAATNRDLAEEVSRGNFREDLFYRLNMLTINVPPLRDRKDDIPLLAGYFLKRLATDVSPVTDISPEALTRLRNYNWPGNIRELENVIRRSVALGKADIIHLEDLPAEIYDLLRNRSSNPVQPPDDSLAAYEIVAIQNALAQSGGHRAQAAKILKIGEATLYRKTKKYRI